MYVNMNVYAQYKNTLFCNISLFKKFKSHRYPTETRVVGSLYVPRDKVYYVNNEGLLIIHTVSAI